MREKNLPVLFLNLLRSKVKWKLLYDAKTMLLFVSALCCKFYNAQFYGVGLAFHCWCHAVVIIVWYFTVGYQLMVL